MSTKVPASRTRVGKYELGRTLGEGSFAKVKFAKNVDTGEVFAIKIIKREEILRHKMVEQVRRTIFIVYSFFVRRFFFNSNSGYIIITNCLLLVSLFNIDFSLVYVWFLFSF